jgi:hypothetical protein
MFRPRSCRLETGDAQAGDAAEAFELRLDNLAHTLGRRSSAKVHQQLMLPCGRSIERALDRRRLAIGAYRGF